jgi:photosystem II stability/assembly factor-like uncharacterized protein
MKKIFSTLCFVSFIFLHNSPAQWFPQNSGTTAGLNSVFFIDEYTGWACGNGGIVLKTTDGGTNWLQLSSGTSNDLYTIYFEDYNMGWTAGENATIIKTTDGGNLWVSQAANPPIGDIRSIYFTSQNSGWTTGYNEYSPGNFDSYISHTINGGTTWEDNYDIMDEKMFSVMFPGTLNGWNAGTAIYNTTDGGLNWSGSSTGEEFHSVFFINETTGWVAGRDVMMNTGVVINTTDGGLTWTPPITLPAPINSVFFTESGNGWAAGSGGEIYYTSDGGAAWQTEASNVTSDLNSVFFVNDLIGWTVGGNGVILKTINAGTPAELTSFTYKVINDNVELSWTTATEINNKGFEIQKQETGDRNRKTGWEKIGFVEGSGTTTEEHSYSFTDLPAGLPTEGWQAGENVITGRYKYRLKQIDFDGSYEYSKEVQVDVNAPNEFSLEQNYPNPFNPATTIKFSIPKEVQVNLVIYDIPGEKVKELKNEVMKTGYYEVNFDASALASGVYFYRIKAGDFVQTKKMILLK